MNMCARLDAILTWPGATSAITTSVLLSWGRAVCSTNEMSGGASACVQHMEGSQGCARPGSSRRQCDGYGMEGVARRKGVC